MKHLRRLPFLLATCACAAMPLAAQQSVQDFKLPPAPRQTGAPAQGPVDADVPVINTPRPRATPTSTPQASPSPAPAVQATPTPVASPASKQAAPARAPAPVATRSQPVPPPLPQAQPTGFAETLPGEPATPPPASSTDPSVLQSSPLPAQEISSGPLLTGWIWAALAALVALLGALVWFLRRRKDAPPPEIQRPVVLDAGMDAAAAEVGPDPLTIKAEAIKLSRSMMNATLHYRLSVTNRSTASLSGLAIGGDLVSAHNRKPVEQQIADPAQVLTARHEIPRLSPGQTINLDGTLQLPLSQVSPIRQGNAPLLVPLMRWRASSALIEPVACTYVVGNQPQMAGGRLQPFRLDEQPQTYSHIGQRAIA